MERSELASGEPLNVCGDTPADGGASVMEGLSLLQAFRAIPCPEVRTRILGYVEAECRLLGLTVPAR